ncbi:AMP-binding protein [Pelomonas sp. KK5]|uniref:AMP-binding protein n=1 Tax=Pelomonas sp. KK5 TaxID=1855730 RepID=UPI001301A531|nr:AMP-binding protein [Pelomonas sp. KK5]
MPPLSVPALLAQRAETSPDAVLIEEVGLGPCSNGEFHRRALELADALATLGVRAGDTVAVMLDPSTAAHVCWIGTAWLKALEVPINPEFRGATLVHALNESGARWLITTAPLLERIAAVRSELRSAPQVFTLDDPALSGGQARPREVPAVTDPYAVIFTSGTTGPSRGVVVPWANIQASIAQQFPGDENAAYADPAFYCPWPTFHASGKVGLVFAAVRGARLVLRQRLSISSYWDDVTAHRCTHTQMMGLAGLLMAQPPSPADGRSPLRRVLMNPVIPEFRAFEQRFGVRVSTGWGATEIGFPVAASDIPDARTCGQLSPLYEARVVDEQGRDVPDGEVGQMMIRGRQPGLLMREYLGRPEATAKAWQDGWFRTGDAMRRDADGYWYFIDRAADYLRVRGNNVSSFEVEREVQSHPQVLACAAVAVPSGGAVMEDEIRVFVMARPGSELSHAALLRHLIDRMPRYMVPRYIEFTDELPRTPTGKVQKKLLRERPLSKATWDRAAAGIELTR